MNQAERFDWEVEADTEVSTAFRDLFEEEVRAEAGPSIQAFRQLVFEQERHEFLANLELAGFSPTD